jgi:hypothetical protein
MSFDMKVGGKALGARFAGLGVATAVAFAITVAPGVALADDATVAPATEEAAVATQVTAPEEAVSEASTVEAVEEAAATTTDTSTTDAAATAATSEETTNKTTEDTGATAGAEQSATEAGEPKATSADESKVADVTEEDDANKTTAASEVKPAEEPASKDKAATAEVTEPAATEPTATVVAETEARNSTAVVNPQNIYRLLNPKTGEHFYTRDYHEAMTIASKQGWQYEGIAYTTSRTTGTPVYRLYERASGLHLWTTDRNEYDTLRRRIGWNDENIAWYGAGPYKVTRLFKRATGQHLFTSDQNEVRILTSQQGWAVEGNSGVWAMSNQKLSIAGNWLVSSSWTGGVERYWIGSDGNIAKNRYVDPSRNSLDRNAGYKAYAKPNGAVVRGTYKINSNHVLLADNDGRVKMNGFNGWAVNSNLYKDSYTMGDMWGNPHVYNNVLHRYYFENGLARIGFFNVGGHRYYGFEGTGFVATDTYFGVGDTVYAANSDGHLSVCNDYHRRAYLYARNVGSPTNYFIAVDQANHRVLVFRKYSGVDPWLFTRESICGVGSARKDGTSRTFQGYGTILNKEYVRDNGYEFYHYLSAYADDGKGGIWSKQTFHGVLHFCSDGSISSNGLGQNVSEGCVRLPDDMAGYIYYMCPIGTAKFTY